MPRHLNFIFSGVNVRCCCVVGIAGGGTPGHLFMGGGVEKKKKKKKKSFFFYRGLSFIRKHFTGKTEFGGSWVIDMA